MDEGDTDDASSEDDPDGGRSDGARSVGGAPGWTHRPPPKPVDSTPGAGARRFRTGLEVLEPGQARARTGSEAVRLSTSRRNSPAVQLRPKRRTVTVVNDSLATTPSRRGGAQAPAADRRPPARRPEPRAYLAELRDAGRAPGQRLDGRRRGLLPNPAPGWRTKLRPQGTPAPAGPAGGDAPSAPRPALSDHGRRAPPRLQQVGLTACPRRPPAAGSAGLALVVDGARASSSKLAGHRPLESQPAHPGAP